MAKLTKKRLVNLSPSDIGKMKRPELREILRGARNLFNAQESVFKKYEGKVWSGALEKMQDFYDEGKRAVSRMTVNQMRNELFRLQDFFESRSSTLPGARSIMKEQDERIFGINEKTGKPKSRLTMDERTKFWAAYNEFKLINKESYVRNMGSNTIQQYLAEKVVESRGKGKKFEPSASFFESLKRELEERKSEEDWEDNDWDGNGVIFSGKRNG